MMYYYWNNGPSERDKLKTRIHNIDEDIVRILFSLNNTRLATFFREYEKVYGESSARYAMKVFSSWKNGVTRYSASSIRKFIQIVPKVISSEERYDIVKKLYEKSKRKSSYCFEIVLGDYQRLNAIVATFNGLCAKPFDHDLSDEFKHLMKWLCDNDAAAANKLLSAFDAENSLLVSKAANKEIYNLINRISKLDGSAVGTHVCNFPFGSVTITVRQPTIFEKIARSFK